MKCSGEAPSCKRCLGKGKQCGYHKSTTTKWQVQVAAARDSIQNLSAGADFQSLEQHGTHHRVLAPRNDAWNLPVDQGLRQSTTTNPPILTNGVQNYPLDLPVWDPIQAFTKFEQAKDWQGDETRSWDDKALLEQGAMTSDIWRSENHQI